MNDIEKLDFALRFAEMDLDALSEGHRLVLREESLAFLAWPPQSDAGAWLARFLNSEHLRDIQLDVCFVFNQLAVFMGLYGKGGERVSYYARALKKFRSAGLMVVPTEQEQYRMTFPVTKGTLVMDFLDPGSLHVQLASDDIRTAFRVALATALAAAGVPALRICPPCGRPFVAKHGKRQFCSDRCKTREMMRRHRATHQTQENERGRKNYRQKAEIKNGDKKKKLGGKGKTLTA